MTYKEYTKRLNDINFIIERSNEITDDKIKSRFIQAANVSKAKLANEILSDLKVNRNIELYIGKELPNNVSIGNTPEDKARTWIVKGASINKDNKVVIELEGAIGYFCGYEVSPIRSELILDNNKL